MVEVGGGGRGNGRFRNISQNQNKPNNARGSKREGDLGPSVEVLSYRSQNNSSQSFSSEIGRDRHLSSIRVDYVQ